MTKVKAHIVLEHDIASDGELRLVRAGIYGGDHHNLTRNLKWLGSTMASCEAETYEQAVEKCHEYVRQMAQHAHMPAWKRLEELLEARK